MKRTPTLALFLFFHFLLFPQKKLDSLEALLPNKSGTEKLKLLIQLKDAYQRSDRQKAWKYFDEFEQLYFSLKEPKEFTARYWHDKGTRLEHEGKFEESIQAYTKAEAASKDSKDYTFLWNLYNGFGSANQGHGDREKTFFYFIKAFKIAEAHLDAGAISGSAMNLGVSYAEAGDLKEALKYFQISKTHEEDGTDSWGYGNSLNNIGQVYAMMEKNDSAFFYFTKALAVWERLNDQSGLAMTHFNLGDLSLRNKDYSTAEAHLLNSLEISERINEQYGITQNLASLSTLYFESGNKKKALEYLERSIEFAKQSSQLRTLQENYNRLYLLHKNNGDFKNALFAHEEFFFWYDSLNNANKNKNLQELYSKFETEKKEKEIQKQKAEISAKNLEIQEERTREIFAWSGVMVLLIASVGILFSLSRHKKKNKIITQKQEETSLQKKLLEEKNQAITSSLQYAQRIQHALISGEELLKNTFDDFFILYQPRDIVSGDFYWAAMLNAKDETGITRKNLLFAACDSTGHGVPGAFMSLLNISFLNQAVNEKNLADPAAILNYVRQMLISAIPDEDSQDGMDACVLRFEITEELPKFSYASANSHLWVCRNNVIAELVFDRMPVGKGPNEKTTFTTLQYTLEKGDQVFCMSDGYADQFGGPKQKKYKYQNLKKVLEANCKESAAVQKSRLEENFSNWKGDSEQTDDVLVVGIKI